MQNVKTRSNPKTAGARGAARSVALAVLLLVALARPVTAGSNWSWELPTDRYRRLNAFERAQYDKAASLLKNASYKAAASEFDKFRIQFGDSAFIPYVLFMKGYSLHRDKKRHSAIAIYNEVLDYFPDQIEDASAALYYLGIAHIENGDIC